MKEITKENGKYFEKQEFDIDRKISKLNTIKQSYLNQIAQIDAELQILQNIK